MVLRLKSICLKWASISHTVASVSERSVCYIIFLASLDFANSARIFFNSRRIFFCPKIKISFLCLCVSNFDTPESDLISFSGVFYSAILSYLESVCDSVQPWGVLLHIVHLSYLRGRVSEYICHCFGLSTFIVPSVCLTPGTKLVAKTGTALPKKERRVALMRVTRLGFC